MTWNPTSPATANQVTNDIPDINENFLHLKDIIETLTNGTLTSTATSAYAIKKYKTIYIPAHQFKPTSTAGCAALANTELATNDIQIEYLGFDKTTKEYATCSFPMPEDYNLGTVLAKFFYVPGSGCTAAETVKWGISAVAVSNDDPIDATLGTEVIVSDAITAGVENDLHVTGTTTDITIGGTPTSGDYVHIKVSRIADDTMDDDANLLGVWIQYLANVQTSEWT